MVLLKTTGCGFSGHARTKSVMLSGTCSRQFDRHSGSSSATPSLGRSTSSHHTRQAVLRVIGFTPGYGVEVAVPFP